MRFAIEQVLRGAGALGAPARRCCRPELDMDTAVAVLQEAASLCQPACCSR
jgi:hypothetical protein